MLWAKVQPAMTDDMIEAALSRGTKIKHQETAARHGNAAELPSAQLRHRATLRLSDGVLHHTTLMLALMRPSTVASSAVRKQGL